MQVMIILDAQPAVMGHSPPAVYYNAGYQAGNYRQM